MQNTHAPKDRYATIHAWTTAILESPATVAQQILVVSSTRSCRGPVEIRKPTYRATQTNGTPEQDRSSIFTLRSDGLTPWKLPRHTTF